MMEQHYTQSTFFFLDFIHFFNAITFTLLTKITDSTYNVNSGRKK